MIIYTDGSYNRKRAPNVCGYGAVIIREDNPDYYVVDVVFGTTDLAEYSALWNVGGELWAVISGIDYAKEVFNPEDITLFYDYYGIEKWVTGEWRCKTPVTQSYKNYMLSKKDNVKISFSKVKGHSGCLLNELADEYANLGITHYLTTGKSCQEVLTGAIISKR